MVIPSDFFYITIEGYYAKYWRWWRLAWNLPWVGDGSNIHGRSSPTDLLECE
jgi:hypothetical protein